MTKILGISAYYHDSACALIEDGKIIAAAQEERFTRKKHDANFPINAAKFCLKQGGFSFDDLDAIAFYDKPLLKLERLLETYYAFAPVGLKSFLRAMPIWIREKLFLRKIIHNEFKDLTQDNPLKIPVLFPEHHLSHAASAFYPSPYEESAILTIDGVGEWATATIGVGQAKSIKLLKELRFPHSIGLLYSAFTYYLGFRVNSGEYKLMGLAPYGDPHSEETQKYKKIILEKMIDLKPDGSVWLNQKYFNYMSGLSMTKDVMWEKLFEFSRREPESELKQHHCNLAQAIQQITEDIVLQMAQHAQELSGLKNLTLAGGVALNCVANGKLLRSNIFDSVWIQPAAGDAGGSLGAALATYYIYFDKNRYISSSSTDAMQGSLLGPESTKREIESMSQKFNAPFELFHDFNELADKVSSLICDGKIVGWHQGKMEWGPRALGNRSILADARNVGMQRKLNLKIKHRESFRPFAPSILFEDVDQIFKLKDESPYMLFVSHLLEEHRVYSSIHNKTMHLSERLSMQRSHFPAITHIDFSSRVQTVRYQTNPRYHILLQKIKHLCGTGIVINTSFNIRGEPPVCTPEDSYVCFMRTEMDYLVINDFLFVKTQQPDWVGKDTWKKHSLLD